MDKQNVMQAYEEHMLSMEARQPIQLEKLNVLQRILLVTDGTVTEILEAYLREHIQLVKITEQFTQLTQALPVMQLQAGEEVIERHIFLRGKTSQKNHVHAKSLLVPARLDEQLRLDILRSDAPLGRLWIEHRLETFRQILSYGQEQAQELAASFDISAEEHLLARTYLVFSKGLPFIVITEKFPLTSF